MIESEAPEEVETIESVLGQIAEAGFRLNGLCEFHDGTWRANFQRRELTQPLFFEFGVGASPKEALKQALVKALNQPGVGEWKAQETEKSTGDLGL